MREAEAIIIWFSKGKMDKKSDQKLGCKIMFAIWKWNMIRLKQILASLMSLEAEKAEKNRKKGKKRTINLDQQILIDFYFQIQTSRI